MRAVIFDFDGTLGDTFGIVMKGVNKLALEEGYDLDVENLRDKSLKRILKEDLKLGWWGFLKYVRIVKSRLNNDLKKAKLFPGVKGLILDLRKYYKVGIVTSNSKDIVCGVLGKVEVDFLHHNSALFGKHRILRKLKEKYGQIVYVGDEIRDIEACKKAGVKVIAVSWGYNSREALEKCGPDYLVDDVKEIARVIERV